MAEPSKISRMSTMAVTVEEGRRILAEAEAREKGVAPAAAAAPAKFSRTSTMAVTIEEGRRILAEAEAREKAALEAAAAAAKKVPAKLSRTSTMAETVDEARRLLKVDAFWRAVEPREKEETAAAAAEGGGDTDDEAAAEGAKKGQKKKKGKKKAAAAKPKKGGRKSVKGGDAEAAHARVEADRVAAERAEREAKVAEARGADRSAHIVDAAWGDAEHHLNVLYLSQERSADFGVRGTTTMGEFFGKLSAEFGVDRNELRLLVHSPIDGSYRQLDGLDAVFHPKTLAEMSILPTDTLHCMRNMMVLAEGAGVATGRAFDSIICDVTWSYPPGVWRDYLDASAVAFDRDGKKLGLVDWRDRQCPALPFLKHSGNMMNDSARQGHDRIWVDVKAITPEVNVIFFLCSSWTAPNIEVFPSPAVSIVDSHNEELCPPHVKTFGTKFRALVLLALVRSATVEGAWDVVALGKGSDGNTRSYPEIERTLSEVCLPIVTAASASH